MSLKCGIENATSEMRDRTSEIGDVSLKCDIEHGRSDIGDISFKCEIEHRTSEM